MNARNLGVMASALCIATLLAGSWRTGSGDAYAGDSIAGAAPGPGPDLTVLEVDASGVNTDCQTLLAEGTVSAIVRNDGTTPTGAGFAVVFFEDANGNGSFEVGTDLLFGDDVVAGSLDAGEETTVSTPLSAAVAFAGNLIYAFADSNDEIAETDETNNYSNTGLACQFEPPMGILDPVLEWSWTSSATLPNHLNVMMTPGVIDLNDDGIPDVVFGSTNSTGGGLVEPGVLRALSGADGTELFTVTDPGSAITTTASVAVGDIDLDTRPEILATDTSGTRLIAFEDDGTFKWISPALEAINWGAPSIADLDLDGTPEIVVGRQALNNDGTISWTGTGGRGAQGSTGPLSLVADIDLDGVPNVVGGNTAYTATGAILWQNGALPDGTNAVADFDDDPFAEIVLISGGTVRLLEHDGSVKWGPVAIPGGGAGGPPTVADYDNDGEAEIGVAGAARYAVFETDGSLKWQAVTQDSSSNRTGSSVFDFEGDGSAEVVYRDELFLRIYRGTDGTVLFQAPMSSCTWHEYVHVADVDADGNAEIVAVANNNCGFGPQRGIFVFGSDSDSWVSTRRLWNQHTYHITNVNEDGTIPIIEQNNWHTFNNYRQNEQTFGSPLAAPDLTASFIEIDTDPCPDSVGILARIGNGGSNVAAAPIDVAFYDGDPNAGGGLLGVSQTTQNLGPGAFEDVNLVLSPALEGAHTICVVADDDGTGNGAASECDETNNQCCADFDGFCCVPVENPAVRTQGFWKRQCAGPHPSGEHGNLPGYVECVNETATFAGVTNVVSLCDRLHPDPPDDKCEQAEAQFMALMLNLCSGRVAVCNPVDDPDLGPTTVGEAAAFIDGLLSNPDRTFQDCELAQAIADRINRGESLPGASAIQGSAGPQALGL
jgi:hypothetical protein